MIRPRMLSGLQYWYEASSNWDGKISTKFYIPPKRPKRPDKVVYGVRGRVTDNLERRENGFPLPMAA